MSGESGYRIPVRASYSASVQTDPGAHPASCKMGTGSISQGGMLKKEQSYASTPLLGLHGLLKGVLYLYLTFLYRTGCNGTTY